MPSQDPREANAPIAVLGAGSWGTALTILLARNGRRVCLWGHHAEHMARVATERENKDFLPGFLLPDSVDVQHELAALVRGSNEILIVVPSHAFRETVSKIADLRSHRSGMVVAWGTKGFDPDRALLLSDVVAELLGAEVSRAVISGPSFATEVARGLPTALTVASDDEAVATRVADWLRNERVRVYTNPDMAGVQLGGAIKNVMALAAGISDGLGFGANARAALITRGLAEMNRLGVALGGRASTFMGLTGVGDLILTCTDDQSRNRRVGIALGRGHSLQQALAEVGQEAEGVNTVRELYNMAVCSRVDMPITEKVYQVIYTHLSPQQAVEELFRREPKSE